MASTQCPHCRAKLKLKSQSALGRKIKCPKCQTPFVAKPAAAPEDDPLADLGDFEDDYGDDYGADSLPPLPRKKSAAGKSPQKKKTSKKKSAGIHPGVIIGSGVVGLLLIVGIVLFASGVFSPADQPNDSNNKQEVAAADSPQKAPGNRPVDLAWLPADAEMLISVDVNGLWNSPLVQSLVHNPQAQQGINEMKQEIGLGPADIQSVTVGIADLEEQKNLATNANLLPGPGAAPGAGSGMPQAEALAKSRYVAVVRTSRQIDPQKIIGSLPNVRNLTHAGKTYYVQPVQAQGEAGEVQGETAFYFSDANTVVFSSVDSMPSVIDSNGQAAPRSDLGFLDASQQILLAIVPKDPSSFFKMPPEEGSQADAPDPLQQALDGKLTGVALGLTVTDRLQMQLQGNFVDASSAQAVSEIIKTESEAALTKLAEAKENFQQPDVQEVLTLLEEMLKGIQQSGRGRMISWTASVPGAKMPTLAKVPGAVMAMAFMGAFDRAGMTPEPGGGFSLPNDSTVTPAPSQGTDQAAEPTKAVDLTEFSKNWQTDITINDQPAGVALKKLAGEMALALEAPNNLSASLQKPVTVQLQGKSRLEAVEEICKQNGIHPVYEQKMQFSRGGDPATVELLRLQPGERPYPAELTGPFLVAVTELRDKAPNPTGHVRLQFVATNLPAGVVKRINEDYNVLEITAVESSTGGPIIDDEYGLMQTGVSEESVNVIRSAKIPLKNLLKSVTAINSITGRIAFDIPTEVNTVKFDQLSEGTTKKVGNLSITLKSAGDSSVQLEMTGVPDDFDSDRMIFEPRDASGQPVDVFGSGGFGFGGKLTQSYHMQGKPASFDLKIISQVANLSYDFALSEIPLAFASKMPEKVEPADFSGHDAPVTLEFVKITGEENFPKALLKAVNHADKDIESISLNLVFLDAAGKELKESSSQLQGEMRFVQRGPGRGETVEEPAVKKNATNQLEAPAFFMPENTKDVRAEVRKVRFVDAEVWEPDE